MPFCEQTLDFLFINRMNDSKLWFEEHRPEYERLVLQPMRDLVTAMAPAMEALDPFIICQPKVGRSISRIYRDTRFTKDKHIFRDCLWCSFSRDKKQFLGRPEFFFEISPRGYRYGCGYYQAANELMESARELIKAEDKGFKKALRAYEKQKTFVLLDSAYKRTRNPDQPEKLRLWLDQRNFCLMATGEDPELMFSETLADRLAEDFKAILPIYQFFLTARDRVYQTEAAAALPKITYAAAALPKIIDNR